MGLTSDALRPRSDAGRGRRSGDEEDAARPGSHHGNRLRRATATRGVKKTQPGPESTHGNRLRGQGHSGGDGAGVSSAGAGTGGAEDGRGRRGRGEGEWRRPEAQRKQFTLRREFPDLVTLDPADDDEHEFGEVWPLIVEWRELKATHPNQGKSLSWLLTEERFLALELTLLEDHALTLPPGDVSAAGLRPERAGQLAEDSALRHAEGAEKARASAQADLRTSVEIAGPGGLRSSGH